MPSDYELSVDECAEIARALMYWLKTRHSAESILSDWNVLQLIVKLGREEEVKIGVK